MGVRRQGGDDHSVGRFIVPDLQRHRTTVGQKKRTETFFFSLLRGGTDIFFPSSHPLCVCEPYRNDAYTYTVAVQKRKVEKSYERRRNERKEEKIEIRNDQKKQR
jgi:hypothetical protein